MRKATFLIGDLVSNSRLPGFLDELSACAVERTKHALTFDLDSPCYQELQARHRLRRQARRSQQRRCGHCGGRGIRT